MSKEKYDFETNKQFRKQVEDVKRKVRKELADKKLEKLLVK